MATILIDNKSYQVPNEVAEMMHELRDQNNFFKKILSWIAFDHMSGPQFSAQVIRKMAEEAVMLYRQ
jgi:predicted TPR repeat methyltransferase